MSVKSISMMSIAFLLLTGTVVAQTSLDGQFRTRGFFDHGYMVPVKEGAHMNYSTDQRSRLMLNHKGKNYSARFTLQDARLWGSDDLYNKTGVEGNAYALGVYEAWVQLRFSEAFHLRLGRQEWNYNDIRIICNRNWWTSGLSYDGALLTFVNAEKGWHFDLGLSYNHHGNRIGLVEHTLWAQDKLKTLNFLNMNKTIGVRSSLTFMSILSGKEDVAANVVPSKVTHGLLFIHNRKGNKTNGLFADLAGYYQYGQDLSKGTNDKHNDVSAYMATAELGLRTISKKLEVSAGAELLSGKDASKTSETYLNTAHTFDLLYGGRFPFYGGYLNHFILQQSYLKGTKSGGYLNPSLKVKYQMNKKNIFHIEWHRPVLTTEVRAHTTINANTGKPAGAETSDNGDPVYWKGGLGNYVDLGFTHKFSKEIIVKSGFSYGIISDIKNQMVYGYQNLSAKTLYETGHNYTGWIMLIVKPHFFVL